MVVNVPPVARLLHLHMREGKSSKRAFTRPRLGCFHTDVARAPGHPGHPGHRTGPRAKPRA